jgi:hypothetical protein
MQNIFSRNKNTMESGTSSEVGLLERINKRDRERKSIIEKRKEEKQQLIVESEQSSYFKNIFYSKCKTIKDWLDSIESVTDKTKIKKIFDNIDDEITILKTYLFDSKFFLKAYDIRRAQDTLQTLENDATQLETKLIPRKKFGFTNSKCCNKSIVKSSDITDYMKDLTIPKAIYINGVLNEDYLKGSKFGYDTCVLIGKYDETIVLDDTFVNKRGMLLTDMTRCTIKIFGSPNTLQVINLVECNVLIGPVTTSVFIDKCHDCKFSFACQQLRLHTSTNCTIYLQITTRAIIEDSTNIYVAPYNWTYKDQMYHFKISGLNPKINNWNIIDDFNWLSIEKNSPNWSVLEPEKRVKFQD